MNIYKMFGLWSQYINDTLAVCVSSYYLEKVEDEDIRPVIEWILDTAKENVSIVVTTIKLKKYQLIIDLGKKM